MNTNRGAARIVGILFILAIVTLFAGEAFYKPILSSPDYLQNAYPNKTIIILGILLEFAGYLGLVIIPVLLFPILKRHNEVLALGYVSFRLFEVVLLSIAQINKLALINLSKDYLNSGSADATLFQNIGSSIQAIIYWVNSDGLIYIAVFVIGGLILYSALYKSKLIPRWMSIWGLIADVTLLTASVLATLDMFPILTIVLMIPIAVQELTMAIWLIVRGFNPNAIASGSV